MGWQPTPGDPPSAPGWFATHCRHCWGSRTPIFEMCEIWLPGQPGISALPPAPQWAKLGWEKSSMLPMGQRLCCHLSMSQPLRNPMLTGMQSGGGGWAGPWLAGEGADPTPRGATPKPLLMGPTCAPEPNFWGALRGQGGRP